MRWVALVLLLTISGCAAPENSTPSTTAVTPSAPASPESQLASLDAKTNVPDGAIEARPYASALDELQRKFPSASRRHLSDLVVRARELLDGKGVSENLLTIANSISGSVPDKAIGSVKPEEVSAAWLVLRTNGR